MRLFHTGPTLCSSHTAIPSKEDGSMSSGRLADAEYSPSKLELTGSVAGAGDITAKQTESVAVLVRESANRCAGSCEIELFLFFTQPPNYLLGENAHAYLGEIWLSKRAGCSQSFSQG